MTEQIPLEAIRISKGRRPLDPAAVEQIASSIAMIGLKIPIDVRPVDGSDEVLLLAGHHRVAACKQLGLVDIAANVIECDDIEAEMWEIAENLHRSDLTTLQRSEQVARWLELSKGRVSAQVGPKVTGRPPGGQRAAARDINITRQEADRSEKIAALTDDAKTAAVNLGLDDNQSALLDAAKQKTPKKQVETLERRARGATPEEQVIAWRRKFSNLVASASDENIAWARAQLDNLSNDG